MRENNGEELLPCPFCQNAMNQVDGDMVHPASSCMLSGHSWPMENAGTWNTRHPDPVKAELVEALDNLLQWAKHVRRRAGVRMDDPHTGAIMAGESALKKAGVQD